MFKVIKNIHGALIPFENAQLYHTSEKGPFSDEMGLINQYEYSPGKVITVCLLDTETASLDAGKSFDYENDQVIELGMLKILVDQENGIIFKVVSALSQLNDPGFPMLLETEALTGLKDSDVQGKSFDFTQINEFISDVDIVLAHNAGFDRKMLRKHTNIFDKMVWGCTSMGDIDWNIYGYSCSKLECLTRKAGGEYPGHRAMPDVFAMLHMLRTHPDALYCIISSALTPTYRVIAYGAPYALKDALKYDLKFSPSYIGGKFMHWFKDVSDPISAETEFLKLSSLYPANKSECITLIPPFENYIN